MDSEDQAAKGQMEEDEDPLQNAEEGEEEMGNGQSGMGSNYEGFEVDESGLADDIFKNNHDLIGVNGILRA